MDDVLKCTVYMIDLNKFSIVNKVFNTDMSINQNATQTSLKAAKNTANN